MKAMQVNEGNVVEILDLPIPEAEPGEVVIKVQYSGVNYKDALAVTGKGKILRSFPMTPGIDAAGVIEASADERFSVGEPVVVTGYAMGERFNGAFAEYVKVAADYVVPLPEGLTAEECMILGTAGFTAAYAVHQMQRNDQQPENGPILVTGATGGVGSLAVNMLSNLGYEVVAVSGKMSQTDWLKSIGATSVVDRNEIDYGTRPLEAARWAGAVDTVGGEPLAGLLPCIKPLGNVAAIGLAAGFKLNTTVMPFILRGVNLLGINSVDCPMPLRKTLWNRLASDLKPTMLNQIHSGDLTLDEIPEFCNKMIASEISGRWLVKL